MAHATLFNYVRFDGATATAATIFSAQSGAVIKLLKGFITFTNCSVTAVLSIFSAGASGTAQIQGATPSNTHGKAWFFDFSPEGFPASATNVGWYLNVTGTAGTITGLFTGTTE